MKYRRLELADLAGLQTAIDADKMHPGEWKTEYFTLPAVYSEVLEDSKGPSAFVLYSVEAPRVLRLSCVWADANDNSRNARTVVFGVRHAADRARICGYTEILIESEHPPLRAFLEKVLGFQPKPDTKDMSLVL